MAGVLVALAVGLVLGGFASRVVLVLLGGLVVVLSLAVRRARATADALTRQVSVQAIELEAHQQESKSLTWELGEANVELERAMTSAEGARDVALAGEARMRLIDEASRVLASSLDYETTVAAVAKLSVPTFADWCTVDLLVDGEIKQLAVAHVDPVRARWARELNAKYPNTLDPNSGVPAVIRTGEPMMISDVSDEMLAAVARDADHLAMLRGLEIRSSIIVPMTARGRTFGAIMLVSTRAARRYGDVDLSVALDLARRAALAVDNARLYRAALAAGDAKTNFLATMSHELRTPLTAIIGYEELLAEGITGPVTEDQRQQLERIRVSALQLLSMIDEILLYARVEAGGEAVRLEPVVAKGAVDDALTFVAAAAAERGLALRSEPTEAALMLRTDAGKLRQMLINLLSNAVKFTTRGDIVVRAFARDESVIFEVRDTRNRHRPRGPRAHLRAILASRTDHNSQDRRQRSGSQRHATARAAARRGRDGAERTVRGQHVPDWVARVARYFDRLSSRLTFSRRRRCRSAPENSADRNARTSSTARDGPITRAPSASTFMSSSSTP